jgi:hypothetical protein
MDVITSDNYKLEDCVHNFHEACISRWFTLSEGCPICRTDQPRDKYVMFKAMLEQQISERYADAIRSLETEIRQLKRRIRQN